MEVYIDDSDLVDFLETGKSKKLKRFSRIISFREGLERALEVMATVTRVEELAHYSFLHFESLKENRAGFYSVRVRNGHPERIIFKLEEEQGVLIIVITELNTTHYGNKK